MSPVERLERPQHEYELPQTLSREQVADLLRAAEPSARDYALLHVLWGCGLRVSEVCALQRTQIDEKNRLIYIAGRVVPIPQETFAGAAKLDGGQSRTADLYDQAAYGAPGVREIPPVWRGFWSQSRHRSCAIRRRSGNWSMEPTPTNSSCSSDTNAKM